MKNILRYRHFFLTSAFLLLLLTGGFPAWTQEIQLTPSGENILYVDKHVSGGGDGSGRSWDNAVRELADALVWAHRQHPR